MNTIKGKIHRYSPLLRKESYYFCYYKANKRHKGDTQKLDDTRQCYDLHLIIRAINTRNCDTISWP